MLASSPCLALLARTGVGRFPTSSSANPLRRAAAACRVNPLPRAQVATAAFASRFASSAPTVKISPDLENDDGGPLIASVDQGTSSSRIILFDQSGKPVASSQVELNQIYPPSKPGWHEHCPDEMWDKVRSCASAISDAVPHSGLLDRVRGMGITNQRETTIAFDSHTGRPYCNAIVWDDTRTASIASSMGDVDAFRAKTGLPLASYFSATKMKWMMDNVESLRADLADPDRRGRVRFGTVDAWLTYKLTGGHTVADSRFVTDVSNASRYMLMDIETLKWDEGLLRAFGDIPATSLPEIVSSSEVYGSVHPAAGMGSDWEGVPVCGILGDQQAALFGQACFGPGTAKNTYGTGLFLMYNTGTVPVPSTKGLLTTVAYQLGEGKPVYALEGSVSHSGSVIQWLRDRLQILDNAAESEERATRDIRSNDGLYFVPAFAGLFAPYWRSDARGCIVGMTAGHTKDHVIRAALEASAYQTREVFDAIMDEDEVKTPLKILKVDGGMSANDFLMQYQSDMLGIDVVRPRVTETTCLGAAFAAGLAVGVWDDIDQIKDLWAADKTWKPNMPDVDRNKYWKGWKKAVTKSFGWVEDGDEQ